MSYDISGYIEVNNHSRWCSMVDLGPLLLNPVEESNLLFGLAKHPVDKPYFGDRGIPEDCSKEVAEVFEENENYKEFDYGDEQFFTYALWSEIEPVLNINSIERNEWRLIFNLAKMLSESLGSTNVRIVLWGGW